jgi:hypothetical protein
MTGADSVATATNARKLSQARLADEEQDSTGEEQDLSGYVTSVKLTTSAGGTENVESVDSTSSSTTDSNGKKVESQTTEQLSFQLDYVLDETILGKIADGEIKSLTYKLPDTVILPDNFDGDVIAGSGDGTTKIGTYVVDKKTNVATITLDEQLIANKISSGNYQSIRDGYLQFWITLDVDKMDNSGKVNNEFNKKGGTESISVTVNTAPSINVAKSSGTPTIDSDKGTITYHYSITVSSKYGTDGTVSLNDSITGNSWIDELKAGATPIIDANTIKIDGKSEIDGKSASDYFTVDSGSMTASGLPEIAAKGSYVITYDAVQTLADNISVDAVADNKVSVSTNTDPSDSAEATTNDSTPYVGNNSSDLSVSKSGSVKPADTDTDKGKVTFTYTVTISSTKGTQGGVSLSDVMTGTPVGDRSISNLSGVSSTGSDVDTSNITTSSSIGKDGEALGGKIRDLKAGETITITYDVTESNIPSTTNATINGYNTIKVSDDNNKDKSAVSWPTYDYHGSGSTPKVTKSVTSADQEKGTITWKVVLNNDLSATLDGTVVTDTLIKSNTDGDTEITQAKVATFEQNGVTLGDFTLPVSFAYGTTDDTATKCYLTDVAGKTVEVFYPSNRISFTYTTTGLESPVISDTYTNTVYATKNNITNEATATQTFRGSVISKECLGATEGTSGEYILSWKTTISGVKSISAGDTLEDELDYSYTEHNQFTQDQINSISIEGVDSSKYSVEVKAQFYWGENASLPGGWGAYEDVMSTYVNSGNVPKVSLAYAYKITFNEAVEVPDGGLVITYNSTTTDLPATTDEVKNKATVTLSGESSSDDASYVIEKDEPESSLIEKYVIDSNGNAVDAVSLTNSKLEKENIVYFKVYLNSERSASGDITFTDTLPTGMEIVPMTSDMVSSLVGSGYASKMAVSGGLAYTYASQYSDVPGSSTIGNWSGEWTWGDFRSAEALGATFSASGQNIAISLPELAYNHADGSYSQYKMIIYYAVKIDTDLLAKEGSLTLKNVATAKDDVSTTTASATVKADVQKLTKNPVSTGSDTDGKAVYYDDETNSVSYTLNINPSAEKIGKGDTITIVDTFDYSAGAKYIDSVNLKANSLKITDAATGAELSTSEYTASLVDTGSTKVLTLILPNSRAVNVAYSYSFIYNSSQNGTMTYTVSNSAEISGYSGDAYNNSSDVAVSDKGSSAGLGLKTTNLELVKNDSIDGLIYLSGATFKLEKYTKTDASSDATWEVAENDLTTGSDGTLKLNNLDCNYYYRLSETKAPEGYKLPETGTYALIYEKNSAANAASGPVFDYKNATDGNYTLVTSSNGYLYLTNEVLNRTIKVTKNWVNAAGAPLADDDIPYDSVNITLYKSTSRTTYDETTGKVKDYTVTKADGWKYTIPDLPVTDDDGNVWYYFVKENDSNVTGFLTEYSNATGITGGDITITNKKPDKEVSLTVKKEWSGDSDYTSVHPSVEVELYEGTSPNGTATGKKLTLSSSNSWKGEFTGLSSSKNYYVVENDVNPRYTVSYTGSLPEGTITVTNTLNKEEKTGSADLSFKKYAAGTTTPLKGAVFTLYKSDKTTVVATATSDNNGDVKFTGIQPESGTEITYYLKETTPPTGYVLNDTWYKVTVTKADTSITESSDKVTYQDNWSVSFKVDDENGSDVDKITPADSTDSYYVIYNDKAVAAIQITKMFGGDVTDSSLSDNQKKSITFTISGPDGYTGPTSFTYADFTLGTDDKIGLGTNGELNLGTYRIENVPFGTYTITETSAALDGYTVSTTYGVGNSGTTTTDKASVEISSTGSYQVVVTNTYSARTSVSGVKIWDDNNNQDGLRPTSITVKLQSKVGTGDFSDVLGTDGKPLTTTATASNADKDGNWIYSFEGLPLYSDGKQISYKVVETGTLDGYTASYDGTNIINTHTPDTVDVSGTKTWLDDDDADGLRPTSITVKLQSRVGTGDFSDVLGTDGKPLTTTATASNADKDGNWIYSFTGLPKYSAGVEIAYQVVEADVPIGYAATYDDAHINITNTHVVGTTSISGTKTWEDSSNQDGLRPSSITVQLQSSVDGTTWTDVTGKTATVEADDDGNWTYSFEGLPQKNNGTQISYRVVETSTVDDYEVSYDEATHLNITNTHTPATVEINGTKTWVDDNDADGLRPTSITVQLQSRVGNGDWADVTGKTATATADNNWTYSFTGLPKYSAGTEISYRVVETSAVDGYEVSYDEATHLNITNTRVKQTEDKGSISFNKAGRSAETCSDKYNELTKLTGVVFNLYKADDKNTVVDTATSNNGVVTFNNVEFGSYVVKEVSTVGDYIADTNTGYDVQVTKDNVDTPAKLANVADNTIINDVLKTNIQIKKVAEEDNSVTLPDSVYGLYKEVATSTGKTETLVATEKTNKDGILKFEGVLVGVSYTIKEIAAPDGSYVSDSPITITFKKDENGKVVLGTFDGGTNTSTGGVTATVDEAGNITWLEPSVRYTFDKVDENNKPLAGATLQIKDSNGDVVEEWKTDGTSHEVTRVLVIGSTYKLIEKEAPTGYKLADDIEFTVSDDKVAAGEDIVVNITMVDKKETTTTEKVTTTQETTTTEEVTTTEEEIIEDEDTTEEEITEDEDTTDEEITDEEITTTDATVTTVSSSNSTTEKSTSNSKAYRTGDQVPVIPIVVILIACLAGCGIIVIRKKRRDEENENENK